MKKFLFILLISFHVSNGFSQPLEILVENSRQARNYSVCEDNSGNYYIAGGIEQYKHNYHQLKNSRDLRLIKIFNNGDTISKTFSRNGYTYTVPHLTKNDKEEIIIAYVLSPCRDTLSPNYNILFLESDTTSAKIGIAKVDQSLNLYEVKEHLLNLYSTENCFIYKPILKNQNNTFTVMVMELGVIHYYHSLSFFTFNDSGDIIESNKYMIYHGSVLDSIPNGHLSGAIYNLAHDFDDEGFLLMIIYRIPYMINMNENFTINNMTGFQLSSYPYSTTYQNCLINSQEGNYLYLSTRDHTFNANSLSIRKFDENLSIDKHYQEAFHDYKSDPAERLSIDFIDEQNIFFVGASFDSYEHEYYAQFHTFFILKHLNSNLELQNEYYYEYNETAHQVLQSVKATNDGGCILLGEIWDWNNPFNNHHYNPIILKYPPEAFTGIDEAHEHGLKVAVVYPSPGSEKMCVRTSVPKAAIEVFDLSGKMVLQQTLYQVETEFSTEKWSAGIYVWRIYSERKVVETGKWVKQ